MRKGITDQVAKESSDSTASDHPLHDQSDQAAKAHKGAPVSLPLRYNQSPKFADINPSHVIGE